VAVPEVDDQLTVLKCPIVGMKTCIAGARGVNSNKFRKAWQSELGHAVERYKKRTRSRGDRGILANT
jgi:hypothetical protein